jgi:hypothetical protein
MNRLLSSIRDRRRFIVALQNCVVQIWRVGFARIERDDDAFAREIDLYVLHPGNVLQARVAAYARTHRNLHLLWRFRSFPTPR